MDAPRHGTVIDAFGSLIKADPARPLYTFYDDAVGERTELSGETLANWVNKTANLLVDGCGLGVGDVAAVRLPAHWQTAAVLLGCWSAGLLVDLGQGPVDLGQVPAGSAEPRPVGVAFVADPFLSDERLAEIRGADVFALALAPLAAPFRPAPPPGTLDYVVEVRAHGDHFTPLGPVLPGTVALADGATHADLITAATIGEINDRGEKWPLQGHKSSTIIGRVDRSGAASGDRDRVTGAGRR